MFLSFKIEVCNIELLFASHQSRAYTFAPKNPFSMVRYSCLIQKFQLGWSCI